MRKEKVMRGGLESESEAIEEPQKGGNPMEILIAEVAEILREQRRE